MRITLTPQTSATRPGLVRIIANFQATGANVVSELNFQAAVPKVRARFAGACNALLMLPHRDYPVSTTADGTYLFANHPARQH